MSEKGKCIIAYIFGWIGGLIILFAIKDNERNTKFHAAQSIVLSVGYFVLSFAYILIPLYIPFFTTALWTIYMVGFVMGIVKASKNDNPELPVIGKIAKAIFGKKIEG